MAEHLADDEYRIVDLTVQRSGGSAACFVRHPKKHRAELDSFFEKTGRNYTRFNYFGEWHSHPSFSTMPSAYDLKTMQSLASDRAVGAEFLALLVVKLEEDATLASSATIFRPDGRPSNADLLLDPPAIEPHTAHPVIYESESDRTQSARIPEDKVHVKKGV